VEAQGRLRLELMQARTELAFLLSESSLRSSQRSSKRAAPDQQASRNDQRGIANGRLERSSALARDPAGIEVFPFPSRRATLITGGQFDERNNRQD
jgi:hypothetical protein